MMGQKSFTPKLFHSLFLGEMIPKDHLLRRLEVVVDLSFIRQLCAPYYSHTGQPSVDPTVLFKMMLLGYLYGITSERRLAEECSLHLAFRWYLGYDLDEPTPDHSVLSKARTRYGRKVFEAFFQRVLSLCVEPMDTSDLCHEGPPSTNVRGKPAGTPDPPVETKEPIKASLKENPSSVNPDIRPLLKRRGRKPKPRRLTNILKVSQTDPDASIITRPGLGTILAYKEHFTVDSQNRVITAIEVTPAAHEDHEQVQKLLDRQPIKPHEFCADSHYGVSNVYAELRRRGIRPIIPRRSPQARKPKPGRLPSSAFEYVAEEDVYLCPQGKILRRVAYDARWHRYHYRPKSKDCRTCTLRHSCSSPNALRTIIRYPDQEAIEWALDYFKSPEGQCTFSQRGVMAEWVIAEAKGFHGLRRALYRGLEKVKIQALLIASVQNLKRLLHAVEGQIQIMLWLIKRYAKIFNLQLKAT